MPERRAKRRAMRVSSLAMLLALATGCRRQQTPQVASVGHEHVARPVAATPELTPTTVLAKIERSYLGGMRQCYRARLKRDPRTRGRMVVTFTVDAAGRLSARRARGVGR